jgi:ABC-type amino acid transport substrate-binding protein
MKRIPRVALAVLLALLMPFLACAQTVRIAHDQRFPPFVEVVDGRSVGLAADVLLAAAQRAGVDIVFVPVPFEVVQSTLDDGRADAIFPIAINPQRLETLDFSAPLVSTGGGLFMRAPEPTPVSLAAMAGKTVVTPRTGPLAGYIERNAPQVKLLVTSTYDESLAKLMSGEADAAALNFQVGAGLAEKLYPGKVTRADKLFLELPLAVATAKGRQPDLLLKLNGGLQSIRADGTWKAINDRWLGR